MITINGQRVSPKFNNLKIKNNVISSNPLTELANRESRAG